MPAAVSFHLVHEPLRRAPAAMARLAADRVRLRATPGLRFARLLGTGRGSSTALGADPARTAMFATWDSSEALLAFEAGWFGHRLARVRFGGGETYSMRLALMSGSGSWSGRPVLDDLERGEPGGPVVVLTRARVRPRAWRAFRAAASAVAEEVDTAPGLLALVAIGEAPIGLLGTFSLWADAASATRFAFGRGAHRDVVRRTRDEGWYDEDLFARFTPVTWSGTWGGRDPLNSER